jgi:hypothetical protein
MKQKIIITIWSTLFLLCAFTVSAADRPNIVYIISDDQAWTDYGFMGHPQIKTPNLDKFARQSVVFEDMFRLPFVVHPWQLWRPGISPIGMA